MIQKEIQFFWPLTEQIPLDLDYTNCDAQKYVYSELTGVSFLGAGAGLSFVSNAPTWTTSINIDTNNITIISKNKQPFYRRVLYKLLGIRWEQQ
jgi:hypothetical protein